MTRTANSPVPINARTEEGVILDSSDEGIGLLSHNRRLYRSVSFLQPALIAWQWVNGVAVLDAAVQDWII